MVVKWGKRGFFKVEKHKKIFSRKAAKAQRKDEEKPL